MSSRSDGFLTDVLRSRSGNPSLRPQPQPRRLGTLGHLWQRQSNLAHPFQSNRVGRINARALLAVRPANRSLYTLSANLQGFTVQAFVHPQGLSKFCASVLVDQVRVPGLPSSQFTTLKAAAKAAKGLFTQWTLEILNRV